MQCRYAIRKSVWELGEFVQGWALVVRVVDAIPVSVAIADVVISPCEDFDGHCFCLPSSGHVHGRSRESASTGGRAAARPYVLLNLRSQAKISALRLSKGRVDRQGLQLNMSGMLAFSIPRDGTPSPCAFLHSLRPHHDLKLVAWLYQAFEGFLHPLKRDGLHVADHWLYGQLPGRH